MIASELEFLKASVRFSELGAMVRPPLQAFRQFLVGRLISTGGLCAIVSRFIRHGGRCSQAGQHGAGTDEQGRPEICSQATRRRLIHGEPLFCHATAKAAWSDATQIRRFPPRAGFAPYAIHLTRSPAVA